MGAQINDSLETQASNILLKNDMLKLPVNLAQIAENYNIDAYESELPDEVSGAIRYNQDTKKFEILLNEKDSESDKRFTFAHELAHFFLTQQALVASGIPHIDIKYHLRGPNPADKDEEDADYFATALLMDRDLLKVMRRDGNSISRLAEIFGVSESAVTRRLIDLNYL